MEKKHDKVGEMGKQLQGQQIMERNGKTTSGTTYNGKKKGMNGENIF